MKSLVGIVFICRRKCRKSSRTCPTATRHGGIDSEKRGMTIGEVGGEEEEGVAATATVDEGAAEASWGVETQVAQGQVSRSLAAEGVEAGVAVDDVGNAMIPCADSRFDVAGCYRQR